jgi:hypothetical protein
MILLFADHCCLGDEEKSEAFDLYSSFVNFAAAGFEGNVNSGMTVLVLPVYEAYVAKDVSLRMAQCLKPVDLSAVLTMGI